jgi:hypothetical protein
VDASKLGKKPFKALAVAWRDKFFGFDDFSFKSAISEIAS